MTTRNTRSEGRRSSNKEVSDLIQKARAQGWTVIGSSGGHWIFRSPDKSQAQVVVPGTPSDYRSMKNSKSALRRAGLVLNRRRRLRRNPSMSTGAMVAIGVGVALGIVLLSRRPAPSVATYTPAGAPSPERIAEAIRGNREAEIARMMARNPGLTRADAEARYDRAVGAITSIAAAFTRPAVSGIGGYYRS